MHRATYQPVQPNNFLHWCTTFDLLTFFSNLFCSLLTMQTAYGKLHFIILLFLFKDFKNISKKTDVVLTFFSPSLSVSTRYIHVGELSVQTAKLLAGVTFDPIPLTSVNTPCGLFFTQTWGWTLLCLLHLLVDRQTVFLFKNNTTLVSACPVLRISISVCGIRWRDRDTGDERSGRIQ